MKKAGKRHSKAQEVADLTGEYSLPEAVELLGKMPKTKFDETVVLAVHLGVDPKQSDQMVRGTVVLPHGSGRRVKVLAFTDDPQSALGAGADEAGLHDILQKINDGWLDFDVAVATTSAMKEVRSVARILGPRGLMPNPKTGTVSDDLSSAIQAVKAGRVEFKMDKAANLAIVLGKRSFDSQKLIENGEASIDVLSKARPEDFRGKFVTSMTIAGTMTPGVKLSSKIFGKF
ncbi:MAG: 50S ribosomal protein L1 [Puniceicoccales bacterium]|jgi:large subunit ribosomal protein L1|nr:50S ribosomal protein L1 [Puniceicoccales bacterium]